MRYPWLPALLALAAFTPSPVTAQMARQIVTSQLNAMAPTIGSQGYFLDSSVLPAGALIGVLRKQSGVSVELDLRANTEYVIMGGCDGDCEDMDLSLVDPSQQRIARDIDDDDTPVLMFTTKAGGPHLLTINMAGCNTDVCYFGIRAFRK